MELSSAKRTALLACWISKGLQKSNGAWRGADDKPISGVTVADLSRDGLLTISKSNGVGVAQLTDAGLLQAQLIDEVLKRND
jgi:hypothetical protein